MILSSHTMVGLLIGTVVQNPIVAVSISFIGHFAGDLIPHWDFFDHFPSKKDLFSGWQSKVFFADITLGILLGSSFTLYALLIKHDQSLALNIFLCGIAGVLPDAMYAPIVFTNNQNKILRFFYKTQGTLHSHAGIIFGNITQIGVLIVAFLLTANLLQR